MTAKIGSLFSGYGGLDMGVQAAVGGRTAWVSDVDPGACKILAHRYPGVPNIGDITAVQWDQVEPVDVLTGGFPCQDVSAAGKRLGMKPGTRSGLWSHMAYAIDKLRPALVVAENVRGLLSASSHSDLEPCPWCLGDGGDVSLRALGGVLGDLADLGYDASWQGLRASDVGAPHGRFRVFVIAWPSADTDRLGHERTRGARDGWTRPANGSLSAASHPGRDGRCGSPERHSGAQGGVSASLGDDSDRRALAASDSDSGRRGADLDHVRPGQPDLGRSPDADAPSDGRHERRTEPAGQLRRSHAAVGGHGADADTIGSRRDRWARDPVGEPVERAAAAGASAGDLDWGIYEPAIRRWERVTRPAPPIAEIGTRGGHRLAPAFSEWLMGLPAGHVTQVPGLTRNEQLKALGNGVVPHQAAEALRILLPDSRMENVA